MFHFGFMSQAICLHGKVKWFHIGTPQVSTQNASRLFPFARFHGGGFSNLCTMSFVSKSY